MTRKTLKRQLMSKNKKTVRRIKKNVKRSKSTRSKYIMKSQQGGAPKVGDSVVVDQLEKGNIYIIIQTNDSGEESYFNAIFKSLKTNNNGDQTLIFEDLKEQKITIKISILDTYQPRFILIQEGDLDLNNINHSINIANY